MSLNPLHYPGVLAAVSLVAALGCSGPAPEAPDAPAAPTDARPAALADEALLAQLTPRGREAYQRLHAAVRFTDDAIYDGGVTPNEVIAWRRLFEEPAARPAFLRLERDATLPGRLFALCALYHLDPAAFQERLPAWRAEPGTVFFQTGCTGLRDYPVRELVTSSRPHPVRLRAGETIRGWMEREGGADAYDVEGGGWPCVFRDSGGWKAVVAEDYTPERGP